MPGEPSVPGYWAAEEVWPSKRIVEQVHYLNGAGVLGTSAVPGEPAMLNPIETVGVDSGKWCPSGAGGVADLDTELPFDQRVDDARSLTFDSPPLQESFEILGACVLTLELAVDRPVAFIASHSARAMTASASSASRAGANWRMACERRVSFTTGMAEASRS